MSNPPNGIVSDYDYDALHRLVSLTHTRTSDQAVLGRFDYTLGTDGRRVAVNELDAQGNLTRIDWTYDELGRLITEAYDLDADDLFDQGDFTADYYFDLVGNRVRKETDNDADAAVDEVISYLHDDNDRLLVESLDSDGDAVIDQTTVYEYGPNAVTGTFGGDWTVQTKKTVWQGTDTDPGTGTKLSETTSSYNLQGRLEQVEIDSDGDGTPDSTSSYTYNDQGIRTSQTVGGVTTDYVIDTNNHTGYAQVLEERNGSTGVVEKTFTIGHDIIAQQAPTEASGSALFLLADGHGSTRQLVDATGQPLSSEIYRYDAYGNPIGFDPSAALTTLLYSGEQTDRATGQQYLRARYYDVATGRFNRLDPFAGNLEDPQSLHKYLYANGNPINLIDPTGMFGVAGFGAGIGLAFSIANVKNSADLAVFDAMANTVAGLQAGHTATQIFTSFLINQSIGFGIGAAIGAASRWAQFLLDNGVPSAGVARIGGAGDNLVGLRNARNFKPGRLQQGGDTCGLFCAGSILDGIAPNRASTSLDASFGTTTHEILRRRNGVGLDTAQLAQLIENNAPGVGALIQRNVTGEALSLQQWFLVFVVLGSVGYFISTCN